MPVSQEYLDYLIDQMKAFGPVTAKRMFGGAGLYYRGAFFGLVADDALYFKVNSGVSAFPAACCGVSERTRLCSYLENRYSLRRLD